MKEIKFRALDFEDKFMTYFTFNDFDTDGMVKTKYGKFRPQNEDEIMLCTGLKDKNGVEIYEGDICNDGEIGVVEYWDDFAEFQLVGKNALKTQFYNHPLWTNKKNLEVIGNIYQNPELMV